MSNPDSNTHSFIPKSVSSKALNDFFSILKNTLSELVTADSTLSRIGSTAGLTAAELKELGNTAFESADRYGKTVSEYLAGVQKMYQAGIDNASQMAELSMTAQAAGNLTAEMADNCLLAASSAYNLKGNTTELNKVLDGQNNISNHSAVSMETMAQAATESASAASRYGVQLKELSALAATAASETHASGIETGNALNTIFANLQDTSDSEVTGALDSISISMTKIENGAEKLKTPIELLTELAEIFPSLDSGSLAKADILNSIGGSAYSDTLSAILSDFDTYYRMLELYSGGTGSALQDAASSADTVSGSLTKLSNTWAEFLNIIADSDTLITLTNLLNGLLSTFNSISNQGAALGSVIGLIQSLTGHGEIVLRPSL